MSVASEFNTTALKRVERNTFRFLKNNKTVLEKFNNLAPMAGAQYDRIHSEHLLERSNISFSADFKVFWNSKDLRIHLGAKIQNGRATHDLAICDCTSGTCDIKRRFHFDFDKNAHKSNHPNFHMQYAGEPPPHLKDHNTDDYDLVLNPELSEPRFFSPPVTFALVLNLVLKEFDTDVTSELREDDKWRALIKDNESSVLQPYFKKCNDFFTSTANQDARRLFFTDYCYGK